MDIMKTEGRRVAMAAGILVVVLASGAFLAALGLWSVSRRLAEIEKRFDREREAAAAWIPREGAFNALAALERRLRRLEESESARARVEGAGTGDSATSAPSLKKKRISTEHEPELDGIRGELEALRNWLIQAEGFVFVGGSPDLFPSEVLSQAAPSREGSNPSAEAFSIGQILGAPDVSGWGDSGRAWCPKEPHSGSEWIKLEYDGPVLAIGVIVRENHSPGAVAAVEGVNDRGEYMTLWEGMDPTRSGQGNLVVRFGSGGFRTSIIRLWLDTTRVPGHNEIDAVGLISSDRIHWAVAAEASSSFGE